MSILEEITGNRGPLYVIGYGIGELCAAWRTARELLKAGCSTESVSHILKMPAEHVEAANKLGHDEDAYENLLNEVSSIVEGAYDDLLDFPLMWAMALLECENAKTSIIDDPQIVS